MNRRAAARGAQVAAVLLVVAAYAFFGSVGTFEFRRIDWADSYYASLSEGFLAGRLSMAHEPDPALVILPDPYIMELREGVPYLWDASYFRGRYYLYFSPVPALLFTIPHRLIARGYPSDALTVTFFMSWSFLAGVAFIRRALHLTPQRAHVPLPFWTLLIGLGNLVPFTLIYPRVYDVAIACGMAMSATWAYTLLRFLESPTWRRAGVMGIFLALAIATRPNMAVLGIVTLVAIGSVTDRRRIVAALAAAAVPLIIVGSAYASYNYARFRSPFELGMTYQLTTVPMRDETRCGITSVGDATRFLDFAMHYLFLPPKFVSTFPFVDLRWNDVDRAVSFRAASEQMGGVAPIAPLTLLGALAAALVILSGRWRSAEARAAVMVVAAGWIVMLSLSACRWITSRYALDFMTLIAVGSVVVIEDALTFLRSSGVAVRPLRILCVLLVLYSVAVGTMLGFARNGTFREANPGLFERIGRLAGPR